MAAKWSGMQVRSRLQAALNKAVADGEALVQAYPDWTETFQAMMQPKYPKSFFPVVCVFLVARSEDDTLDVLKVKSYSSTLIATNLTSFAEANEVDTRSFSTNVLNSSTFIKVEEITDDLTKDRDYPHFFNTAKSINGLSSTEAMDLLALAMHLGRANWPNRLPRHGAKKPVGTPKKGTQGAGPEPWQPAEHHFILNQSPKEEFAHYDDDARAYYGFHENVTSAKALVDAAAGRFVFYRTSHAKEHPMCFVGQGVIDRVEEQDPDDEGRRRWHAYIQDYTEFDTPVPKKEGMPGPGWNVQHSIVRITGAAFERIVTLGSGGTPPGRLTTAALKSKVAAIDLLIDDGVLAALVAALESGKHVILTGPPGTAKTTLAVATAELAASMGLCDGFILTTATADWSTYDTIGGLTPTASGVGLDFKFGTFLEAIAQERWLIVDEMNRSNFDRAFGPLFTVLAGADVVLQHSHPKTGLVLRVRHESSEPDEQHHDVVVPGDWRMIATINNFDKSLLFEMSFALMRRFAFVEVPAPSNSVYVDLIKAAAGESEVGEAAAAVVESFLALRPIKEIGPALFMDAARMAAAMMADVEGIAADEVAVHLFYAFFLPQFEGIDEPTGSRLLATATKAVGTAQRQRLRRMLREVLGLVLKDSGHSTAVPAPDDDEGDDPDADA